MTESVPKTKKSDRTPFAALLLRHPENRQNCLIPLWKVPAIPESAVNNRYPMAMRDFGALSRRPEIAAISPTRFDKETLLGMV